MTVNDSVLSRALGTGASAAENLGMYKDAGGAATTYRPEFAGQTVQIGNQYVTYNEQGYPVRSIGVKYAQSLGNDYTKQHFGLDQTQIANAGDIYKGIYNAVMEKASTVSGSALDNAYGKRNIQYEGALGPEEYDTLIREAVAAGNHVLAGFYEDSRNALIADKGLSPALQSSTYNGGWNYVDGGGGVGDIHAGAKEDPEQSEQALGGGWYAGQGKGNAEHEYIYRNSDAPSVEEVLRYAAAHGYTVETEADMEKLTLQIMAEGYVSEETLRKAEILSPAILAALENLGLESHNSGTEALLAAVRSLQGKE